MRVKIFHKEKRVEYWLTKKEINDASFLEGLKPEFQEWKQKKYISVVFESGDSCLEDDLKALMRQNSNSVAQKQTETV